jgi:2-polyprenyl-3-methyl-5-hydroxy-6-metoxy-1,4-benzoquinol methylase
LKLKSLVFGREEYVKSTHLANYGMLGTIHQNIDLGELMSKILQGPSGNYYDKFNSKNPITRWLMNGFTTTFLELYGRAQAQKILEIGCGEGHMLTLMNQHEDMELHGFDVDIPILHEALQANPRSLITMVDAHHIAYPSHSFDLVVACEVLEHVENPARVLEEAQRVTRRYGIFSVPREPIWRVLNVARGKYWGDLGNTPGHINHWSTDSFVDLVGQYFNIIEVHQPLPWTMLLAEIKS